MPIATTSMFTQLMAWPMDWPLLGIVAALLALESFISGSTRTSAISLSIPIASILCSWLPTTYITGTIVQQVSTPILQAGLFAVVLVAIFYVIHRMIFSYGSAGGDVVNSILHGLSATVILIVFWIQTPGVKDLWVFGPQVQMVFGEAFRAWWLVSSFAALAYTRG